MSNSSCLDSPLSLAMSASAVRGVRLDSGRAASGQSMIAQQGSGARMGEGESSDAHDPTPPVALAPRVRLERLFANHHTVVWRTLRRMGADAEVAADLTQQAFLVVAERMADIRPGAERGFLFTTALTLLHTRRRRESRCQLEEDMTRFGPVQTRDVLMSKSYARQLLDRVLSDMDPQLIVVFALYELEGMTTPEISVTLGIPLGTAASRLRRARESFRSEVERLEELPALEGLK